MASPGGSLIRELRAAVLRREPSGLSDGELLECFVLERDEAAFEALLRRHGPMVLGTCRRLLNNEADAEDAFQATFLVLAKRAASVVPRAMVGNWLYGVARRTALKARVAAARRRAKEREAAKMAEREEPADGAWSDLRPLLDRELGTLPDKYRAALVLCDLEGKPRQEAARQLGWPEGTLSCRLARGRALLARRLKRRGLTLTAAALAAALAGNAAAAAVPGPLAAGTVKAAAAVAAGVGPAGVVSAPVAALTEGVLRSMFLVKQQLRVAVLLTLGALTAGAGALGQPARAQKREEPPPAEARRAQPEAPRRRPDGRFPSLAGRVVAAAADGKAMTLEVRPRGQAARKVEVQLPADAEVSYDQVGPGGAKPTAGYTARVWLKEGSDDTAERVSFLGFDPNRRTALMGRVNAVAEDGKSFTLQAVFGMEDLRETGVQSAPVEIKLTPQTQVTFSGVGVDGARPAVGDRAQVSLVSGSKDTAARVHFTGPDTTAAWRGPRADYSGKVVALDAGGKGLTLELQRRPPGDAEGKRVEVRFTPRTKALFDSVPAGGAKPTVGYRAEVWLAEGSKDTAVTVRYLGSRPNRAASLSGKVTAAAADGKSFTLETTPARGAAAKTVTVKLTEKTRVTYSGVGPGGAKPTAGYRASLLLEDGSPDTAAQVRFSGAADTWRGFGPGGLGGGGVGGGGGLPPDDPE
jgi:RNA polymerase sigma factor (sigma-70 family)